MESLKPYLDQLIPLTTLEKRVENFAALCHPDYTYSKESPRGMSFAEIDIAPFTGDELPEIFVGITMELNKKPQPFVFTKWSRGQLLSHLGTREKWFETVLKNQQVNELNVRRHALEHYVLRTMRSFDSPELNIVRGLVSSQYADIPDTDIMKALTQIMPEGYALARFSGKTDRAFYAYAIVSDKIGIPGTKFSGFPGIVLKNSEVGFTSLWVIPMLWLTEYDVPIVFSRKQVLKRTHRGNVKEIAEQFAGALDKTKVLWGPLEERMSKLRLIQYVDEQAAVNAMTELLISVGSPKFFIHHCEGSYRSAKHGYHDAFGVFEAVLENIGSTEGQDQDFVHAELAGGLLLKLIE